MSNRRDRRERSPCPRAPNHRAGTRLITLLLLLALSACVGDSAKPPTEAAPHTPSAAGRTANDSGSLHSATTVSEPSSVVDPSSLTPSDAGPPPTTDLAGDLDHDEMIGLGELGALPGLLDSFAPSPDCDFDEPLSSCQ